VREVSWSGAAAEEAGIVTRRKDIKGKPVTLEEVERELGPASTWDGALESARRQQEEPTPPVVLTQLDWWTAMTTHQPRLFETWLAVYKVIVISARSIERYDMFFQALAKRGRVRVLSHAAGFELRART